MRSYKPTQISLIVEIGGEKFFVVDLAALIDDWIQKNRVTPAVIHQNLSVFLYERQTYIELITRLRDSLNAVGIKAITLGEGDAEIGILLPRNLFNNELESLIKELREIRFIFRAFSELATGFAERIEVTANIDLRSTILLPPKPDDDRFTRRSRHLGP